ncbi:MAG: cadherin repeat domain-containing protein, partial [Verrucomicrobiales bacterium]|nr:cadherin repeat domain-containing protein [Verrucomicrobiales bacterium]
TVSVVVTDFSPFAINETRWSVTNSFRVVVREVNVAPSLVLPADLALDELTTFAAAAQAADRDFPANPLTFSLVSAPAGLVIDPRTGALQWIPTEQQGPSENPVVVVVSDASPSAVNAIQLSVTNRFILTVREVNTAPQLSTTEDFTMDEGNPVTVSHRAPDPDIPLNTVTFSLAGAPAGAAIGADGTVTWTAGESDGSTTNRFLVVARDNGSPSLSVTNAFSVVVREKNTAPILTVPSDQTIEEGATLTISASASDADLPANPLTYRLVAVPEGMTIQPQTGAITWTPGEVHGGSTRTITVVVTDSNPSAVDAPTLSVTNSFRVTVKEVNAAPVVASVADVSVHYGSPLALTVAATDADVPANLLGYELERAPEGMTLDLRTGALTWNPTQAAVGIHPVTVKVTDNGDPAQSSTITFQVTVFGAGARLAIGVLGGGLKQITSTGETGLDYELQASGDLAVWERLVDFRMTATPHVYIDPPALGANVRFYRLRLRQP